tara:strand:- start:374 stop:730 length:357 start_codon:yes stop_codon:yes gene_type:complete
MDHSVFLREVEIEINTFSVFDLNDGFSAFVVLTAAASSATTSPSAPSATIIPLIIRVRFILETQEGIGLYFALVCSSTTLMLDLNMSLQLIFSLEGHVALSFAYLVRTCVMSHFKMNF